MMNFENDDIFIGYAKSCPIQVVIADCEILDLIAWCQNNVGKQTYAKYYFGRLVFHAGKWAQIWADGKAVFMFKDAAKAVEFKLRFG